MCWIQYFYLSWMLLDSKKHASFPQDLTDWGSVPGAGWKILLKLICQSWQKPKPTFWPLISFRTWMHKNLLHAPELNTNSKWLKYTECSGKTQLKALHPRYGRGWVCCGVGSVIGRCGVAGKGEPPRIRTRKGWTDHWRLAGGRGELPQRNQRPERRLRKWTRRSRLPAQ